MRKSSLVALAIVVVTLGSMLWLLGFYTDQIKFELDTAGEWTRTLRERGDLAEGTRVKVFRAAGGPDGARTDPKAHGLRAELTPSETSLAKDPGSSGLAIELARSAFDRYGPDRAIDWVEVTILRAKGGGKETLSFAKGENGVVLPMGSSAPATRPPVQAPRKNLAPKEPVAPAGTPPTSPGSPAGTPAPK